MTRSVSRLSQQDRQLHELGQVSVNNRRISSHRLRMYGVDDSETNFQPPMTRASAANKDDFFGFYKPLWLAMGY